MIGYRLSQEARDLLRALSEYNGTTATAVLERAIRQVARRELPVSLLQKKSSDMESGG